MWRAGWVPPSLSAMPSTDKGSSGAVSGRAPSDDAQHDSEAAEPLVKAEPALEDSPKHEQLKGVKQEEEREQKGTLLTGFFEASSSIHSFLLCARSGQSCVPML